MLGKIAVSLVSEDPPRPIGRQALRTLVDLQQYLTVERFTLTGAARALGIKEEALRSELAWLVEQAYIEQLPSGAMRLTHRGKIHEEQPPENNGEGFSMQFTRASEPEHTESEDKDGPYRIPDDTVRDPFFLVIPSFLPRGPLGN